MSKHFTPSPRWIALACSLLLAGCVTPGGGLVSTGTSATEAKGGAAGGTSVGANSNLQRCDAPLGTLDAAALRTTLRFGAVVAGLNCAEKGCKPPTRAQVDAVLASS